MRYKSQMLSFAQTDKYFIIKISIGLLKNHHKILYINLSKPGFTSFTTLYYFPNLI